MIDICSLHLLFLLSLFLHITADTLLVPTCLHTLAHLYSTLHRCWLSTADTQNPPLYLSLLPTTSPFHLFFLAAADLHSSAFQGKPPHLTTDHSVIRKHHDTTTVRGDSCLPLSAVWCVIQSHTVWPRGVCITNRGGVEVFQSYTHTQPTLCFYSPSHLVLFLPVLKFEY